MTFERPNQSIDALLGDFMASVDHTESANILAEMIDRRIDPIVRAVIRGKLYVSLNPEDDRQINRDAFDLLSEIKTLIISKLTVLKAGSKTARIANLEAYVRTIAVNSANGYFRRKSPQRLRLKNQLRYVLTHDPRFSLWLAETGDRMCGIHEWSESNDAIVRAAFSANEIEQLADEIRGAFKRPDRLDLVDLTAAVFERAGLPLPFGDLVSVIYVLKRLSEPIAVAEDEIRPGSVASPVLDQIEQAEMLRALWREIKQLSLKHRAALLLNLTAENGDEVLTSLPILRIASIRQIAEVLEIPLHDFVKIWRELPWPDLAIAEHLQITRQQVINLRQTARRQLRKKLERDS